MKMHFLNFNVPRGVNIMLHMHVIGFCYPSHKKRPKTSKTRQRLEKSFISSQATSHTGLSIIAVNKSCLLRRSDSFGPFLKALPQCSNQDRTSIYQGVIQYQPSPLLRIRGGSKKSPVCRSSSRMPKRESVKRSKKEHRHHHRRTTNT